MPEFKTERDYLEFERAVKHKTRFAQDGELREFLETVAHTSKSRREILKKGSTLFRAQRGTAFSVQETGEFEFEIEAPHPRERMIPSPDHVRDGRANTAGIPRLYLATDPDTAMAEVRPWVQSYISLAMFVVMRDCKLVDCTKDKIMITFGASGASPSTQAKESRVWGEIAKAFSKTVAIDEPHLDYVPTQVLADSFRSQGYDGVMYKSLLQKDGINIALFDVSAAEYKRCAVFQTASIDFDFQQRTDWDIALEHNPDMAKNFPGAGLRRKVAADSTGTRTEVRSQGYD